MFDPALQQFLVWGLVVLAPITALALVFVVAPYGRHQKSKSRASLPARWGWMLMESPSLWMFAWVFFQGQHANRLVPLLLMAVWGVHYVHRTLIWPFRMPKSPRRIPWSIVAGAFGFQLWNSYMNAAQIAHLGRYPDCWLYTPPFMAGLLLFGLGMAINLWADSRLFALRKPGETGYKIPRGGLYEYVVSPNYLGEILEWIGWAVMTWSGAGFAFALYTMANLVPRALEHRRWYLEQFPDFPRGRKAVFPGIL